jgi:hypothetical protein
MACLPRLGVKGAWRRPTTGLIRCLRPAVPPLEAPPRSEGPPPRSRWVHERVGRQETRSPVLLPLICAWLLSAPPRWPGGGLPLGLPGACGPRSPSEYPWAYQVPAARGLPSEGSRRDPRVAFIGLSAPPRWPGSRGSVPRGPGSGLPLGLPGACGPARASSAAVPPPRVEPVGFWMRRRGRALARRPLRRGRWGDSLSSSPSCSQRSLSGHPPRLGAEGAWPWPTAPRGRRLRSPATPGTPAGVSPLWGSPPRTLTTRIIFRGVPRPVAPLRIAGGAAGQGTGLPRSASRAGRGGPPAARKALAPLVGSVGGWPLATRPPSRWGPLGPRATSPGAPRPPVGAPRAGALPRGGGGRRGAGEQRGGTRMPGPSRRWGPRAGRARAHRGAPAGQDHR